jgi:hypothetical protein
MNILAKLFTRGGRMTATAEPTESELQEQLANAERVIASGEGDVMAALEARESLKLQLQAAALARQQRADKAYRAKMDATTAEFLTRRDRIMRRVGDHVAGLLLALPELRELMREAHAVSLPRGTTVEECLGVPTSFADNMLQAIRREAPATQWDFRASSPLGLTSERPQLQAPRSYTIHTPSHAPPGYHGVWPPEAGDVDVGLIVLPPAP